jgi:hypothetical protein
MSCYWLYVNANRWGMEESILVIEPTSYQSIVNSNLRTFMGSKIYCERVGFGLFR